MTISRAQTGRQLEGSTMRRPAPGGMSPQAAVIGRAMPRFKKGGKVKGYAKGGKVDQMQSSPRKQAAMKGC